MKRVKKLFVARRADERGATFIFTAICMVALLGASAMGIDVGFSVYGSRQAQAMADTAALDLARYISYADTLTSLTGPNGVQTYLNGKLANVLADNGSNAQLTVIPGYYNAGTFKKNGPTGLTCQATKTPPVQPGCNAVEVTANQSVPQIFFGGFNILNGHAQNAITGAVAGSSIATVTPQSSFSIGTYLINVSSQQQYAVLNKILTPLGTSVNLTAVGYEGLATTNVTLAQLITASGGLLSATNIMSAQLSAAQWLGVWQNAVTTQKASVNCASTPTPSVCTASTALGSLSFSNSSSTLVKLCQLVNINASGTQYNCSNSSISTQGLNASVDVLQMLTTEAELANGTNGLDLTSALNLQQAGLNIGNVNFSIQAIQPAQVAYGPVGTTAKTAQVTSTLSMVLSKTVLGITIPLGTLSFQLSAASGTATLFSTSCVDNALFSSQINGTTTALSTNISLNLLGVVSNAGTLAITGVSGNPGAVNFAGPANGSSPSVVPPTPTTVSNGTNPKSIPTGSQPSPLTITPSGGLDPLITTLLSPTSVLGDALVPVLQAAGITVAGAQIADLSTNCGTVSLVG